MGAAVLSACLCMLIAVAAGFVLEFWMAPPNLTEVAGWAEFQRSGWSDVHAFAIANTLDSGSTHLLMGSLVALFTGWVAAMVVRAKSDKKR